MKPSDTTIKQLCASVMQMPEFLHFKDAADALEKDIRATAILRDVQERQQTIATLQQNRLPVSAEQQKALKDAFATLQSNATCMEFLRAQNAATARASTICNELTVSTGITFASGGGCCG